MSTIPTDLAGAPFATAPPASRAGRAFRMLDRAVGASIEAAAAALVAVEVVLLAAGTAARYLFDHPFPWSDELGQLLFLWLSVLGAAIALRRGQHMRLTTFIRAVPAGPRAFLDALAMMVVALLLAAMIGPAYAHFLQATDGASPVLQINQGWSGAAIGVGVVLMLITALQNLLRFATWRQAAAALAISAALYALLSWFGPAFQDMTTGSLVVFFVLLVAAAMVIGVPIAFAFLLGTLGYIAFATSIPLMIVPDRMNEGMSNIILLAVPMFVLLGALMELAGLARAMIGFFVALIGQFRGGLQYVLLGAMYLVSGISGAKAADMAAVAPSLFPEMIKRGNREGDLVSLLSASAVMSETIPPSIVLITVGSVTGVSIAALFTGGLMPALVGLVALCVVVFFQTRREDLSGVARFSWAARARLGLIALPAIGLPIVIRSAVVRGIATATEVSTVGIVYTVLIGIVLYRQFDWRRIYPILVDTAALTGAILLVIGAATGMAWALTQSGFSQSLAAMMAAVPGGKLGFLLVSALAFIVLGSVLEGVPAIVLFGPLLFPIARLMGVNEIHYAIVAVFAMGFGLFTPPFGVGFYLACAIARVSPDVAIRAVWPHLAALFVALLLITLVPWFSTGFL